MALILENTVYIHVPKCGGQFVRAVLKEAGGRVDEDPSYHGVPLPHVLGHRTVYAGMRHPAPWLRSYWAHRTREGWQKHAHVDTDHRYQAMNDVLDRHRSDSFDEFARDVVASGVGIGFLVSAFYMSGVAILPVRVESMNADLSELAQHEPNHGAIAQACAGHYRVNTSPDLPEISDEVRRAIWESEGEYFSRFGYTEKGLEVHDGGKGVLVT